MAPRFDPSRITALEHQLRVHFGEPTRFGVPLPLPPGLMSNAGKIVLAIAAGDGRITARERETFLSIVRSYGTPEPEVEALRTFQPDPEALGSLASSGAPAFLRCLVYDAIRVARVDGFDDKERAIAEQTVAKLGLEAGLVRAIEALLVIEDALNASRARLLAPPMQLPSGWSTQRAADGAEARAAQFGPAGAVQLPREFHVRISKAVLAIAAGDRDLTETELAYYVGTSKAMGMPEDAIEEVLKFDVVGAKLDEIVDARLRPYAAVIVYEGLRVARADGVSPRERELAERAAQKLGMDPTFVTAVENQIELEAAVREARMSLLQPVR